MCEMHTVLETKKAYFQAYQWTSFVMFLFLLTFTIFFFTRAMVTRWHTIRWTTQTISLFLIILGLFLRIIDFAIDPHAWSGYFSNDYHPVLFNVPLVLWIISYGLQIIKWIELQIRFTPRNKRSCLNRQILSVKVAMVIYAIFPTLFVVLHSSHILPLVGLFLYNIIVGLVMLYLMCLSLYYGTKILTALRKRESQGKNNMHTSKALSNLTLLSVRAGIIIFITFVCLIIARPVGCSKSLNAPQCVLSWYAVFRVEEIIMVSIIIFSIRNKPKINRSSRSGSNKSKSATPMSSIPSKMSFKARSSGFGGTDSKTSLKRNIV